MTNGAISSILRIVILFAQLNVIAYFRLIIYYLYYPPAAGIIQIQIAIRQLIILLIMPEAV
jgi:hypothetical protein